jgi:3-hydroxyacyl-[acyl-carrier-protein] dehydratase
MPPKFLFDLTQIDLSATAHGIEDIRTVNPQRGAMEHLDRIIWVDKSQDNLLGVKHVREDEFWVPGHIPGRPLLPGVIMIEAAAQVASFYTRRYVGWEGFIGFGGVNDCKFRLQVAPGDDLYILCHKTWDRHRRIGCQIQGVVKGNLAFECEIVGAVL